jgi:hypothetical protein
MALNASIDLTVNKPDFKSMKAEIRELTVAAQQAVMQFGEFSPEAIKAEKALAQARDRMEDFNDRVKAVNPDKFAQLNTVVSGVARGFQAAQGAMALFGNQSEELEKTMVKLQGAMALAEGLEGLGKVQQQFGAIAKNIKGGVMSAFKALGNMSTLAFGAIGIALTLIIANFDTLKKAVMSLIPGLGSMVKFVGGLVQQFTDWVGITSAQDRALAKLNKTTEKANDQLDREIALLKARGDEVGVFNKERQKLENDLALARASYGKNNEKNWGKIIDDTKNALKVLEIEQDNYETEKSKSQDQANAEAANKRKADRDKQIQDEKDRQAKLEAERVKAQDQLISAELSANETARELRLAQVEDEGERLQVEYENKLAALKESHIQEQMANVGNAEALALIDQKYADAQMLATVELDKKEEELQKKNAENAIKLAEDTAAKEKAINDKATADQLANEQALMTAKTEMVNATRNAITALGGLFKEGSDAAKAAALVDIAIGTGVGFINALDIAQKGAKATGPAAPFAFPIFYASQLAAVLGAANKAKAILKSGKSGGAASAPSQMGGGGLPQMAAPKVSSTLPEVSGFDQRVYVTEGDISRTQGRVASLKKVSVTQ